MKKGGAANVTDTTQCLVCIRKTKFLENIPKESLPIKKLKKNDITFWDGENWVIDKTYSRNKKKPIETKPLICRRYK